MPLGLPILPEFGSTATYDLLQSWLEDCNHGHGDARLDCMSSRARKYLPNRLLDVGTSTRRRHSRIVKTNAVSKEVEIEYIALSHPWGTQSAENNHFVSTSDNITRHMEQIMDSALPPNFRDAVVRQTEGYNGYSRPVVPTWNVTWTELTLLPHPLVSSTSADPYIAFLGCCTAAEDTIRLDRCALHIAVDTYGLRGLPE